MVISRILVTNTAQHHTMQSVNQHGSYRFDDENLNVRKSSTTCADEGGAVLSYLSLHFQKDANMDIK
jgi:hypothetical protein